jgi:hypothetical protein
MCFHWRSIVPAESAMSLDPELQQLLLLTFGGLLLGALLGSSSLVFRRLKTGKWFPERPVENAAESVDATAAPAPPAWLKSPWISYAGVVLFGALSAMSFIRGASALGGLFALFTVVYIGLAIKLRRQAKRA